MLNKKAICTTETFGFDFVSVCEKHIGNTPPDAHIDELTNSPNVAISHSPSRYDCETSIEEIAEEFREATKEALLAVDDDMDDDDGLTAAEVLGRNMPRSKPTNTPVQNAPMNTQDMTVYCAVEKILDQTLEEAQLAVSRGIIWGASLADRIWKPLQTDAQISNFLHGLGIRCYGKTVRWFASRISGDSAYTAPGFFETTNLWGKVSFADGLLDVRTHNFAKRSLEDRVTAVLRFSYHDVGYSPHYEQLVAAMKGLAVTEESYLRLQEICGVALHAEPAGRILYLQHWNPRVASCFTKLLSRIWSEASVSFLSLRDHERSFRTAQVLEHPILISGKEGESTLCDISTVLALVDGDGVNSERKNLDPFDFVSRCTYICSGRSLPILPKGGMEVLRYYLVRVSLSGDLPDGTSVRDILSCPKEFILWSLEGLQRFILNNGRFTFDEGSDIPREDASILNFVEEMIEADPNGKIPSSILYDAYSSYCAQHDMPVLPKPRLIAYLKETFQTVSRTIRVPWYNGGTPAFGYIGIRFSEEYQALLTELPEDGCEPEISPQTFDDEDDDVLDDDDWQPDFYPSHKLF